MKLILTKSLSTLADLNALAEDINTRLMPGAVVLLSGDLGAGKTSFVAAFCKMHQTTQVQSPTYAIHNRYQTASGEFIDHFDLYRLESEDEINASGFYDLMADKTKYKFVEWPERLSVLHFAEPVFRLNISMTHDGRKADFFSLPNN